MNPILEYMNERIEYFNTEFEVANLASEVHYKDSCWLVVKELQLLKQFIEQQELK